jgi:hypothetical protein
MFNKQAFTIMVGVSMSSEVLLFQTMYAGKTTASLLEINNPKSEFKAANNKAKKLGFRFKPMEFLETTGQISTL